MDSRRAWLSWSTLEMWPKSSWLSIFFYAGMWFVRYSGFSSYSFVLEMNRFHPQLSVDICIFKIWAVLSIWEAFSASKMLNNDKILEFKVLQKAGKDIYHFLEQFEEPEFLEVILSHWLRPMVHGGIIIYSIPHFINVLVGLLMASGVGSSRQDLIAARQAFLLEVLTERN